MKIKTGHQSRGAHNGLNQVLQILNTQPKKKSSFGFKTNSSADISDFSFSLFDSEEKLIQFCDAEKKVRQLEFRKDTLKQGD